MIFSNFLHEVTGVTGADNICWQSSCFEILGAAEKPENGPGIGFLKFYVEFKHDMFLFFFKACIREVVLTFLILVFIFDHIFLTELSLCNIVEI